MVKNGNAGTHMEGGLALLSKYVFLGGKGVGGISTLLAVGVLTCMCAGAGDPEAQRDNLQD